MTKVKVKWLLPLLAALALTLWCASVFAAQGQAETRRSVAARWPEGGVSPAQLESQMDIFREDGTTDIPEMTLWVDFFGQKLENDEEGSISCDVTQIYGQGEDVLSGAMLQGSCPARGNAMDCALSEQAAFSLFGSVNAMGQSLQWNDRTYTVQGVFKSEQAWMLTQAFSDSEMKMPNMQLRFPGGGTRTQAEEFLARTSFGNGALLLDLPLIAWGLQTLAALPALLLGIWVLARLAARAWNKRKYPRLLVADLPLLLPLAAAAICLSVGQIKLPAALIPSGWSDFSFWEALATGWSTHLTEWLRHPAGSDIAFIFAALGILVLVFLSVLTGVLALSHVKLRRPSHVLLAAGGCIAWMFIMALYHQGLRLDLSMWLLPCLWSVTEFGLYAWGRKEGRPDAVTQSAKEPKPAENQA